MARGNVGVEACENFLLRKYLLTVDVASKLSDDELLDYYYKIIKEKNLEVDADRFVHDWCMTYK